MDNVENWWNMEYERDMYEAMKVSERENRPVLKMFDTTRINQLRDLRTCLVNLQKHITEHEHLSRNTLHLGVYIFDVFLNTYTLPDSGMYFVAGVCLILAAKMEDRDLSVPSIEAFDSYLNLQTHTNSAEYAATEFSIMKMLNFKMIIPTAVTFTDYFVWIVVTLQDFEDQRFQEDFNFATFEAFLENAHMFVHRFLDATLSDPLMVQEVPSKVAAACLLATRTILRLTTIWPQNLVHITNYKVSDIIFCASKIMNLCDTPKPDEEVVLCSPESGYGTPSYFKSPASANSFENHSTDEFMSIDE